MTLLLIYHVRKNNPLKLFAAFPAKNAGTAKRLPRELWGQRCPRRRLIIVIITIVVVVVVVVNQINNTDY